MIYFLWPLFSILIGMWNHNKGNSFWVGFLISLFLSPLIGFIIVLVLTPNKKNLEKRELNSGKLKKCPYCGELIKPEAKICRFCQRELEVI